MNTLRPLCKRLVAKTRVVEVSRMTRKPQYDFTPEPPAKGRGGESSTLMSMSGQMQVQRDAESLKPGLAEVANMYKADGDTMAATEKEAVEHDADAAATQAKRKRRIEALRLLEKRAEDKVEDAMESLEDLLYSEELQRIRDDQEEKHETVMGGLHKNAAARNQCTEENITEEEIKERTKRAEVALSCADESNMNVGAIRAGTVSEGGAVLTRINAESPACDAKTGDVSVD
jgi:hypothetical protein